MTDDTKMILESMDVAEEKRQQLKQLFPEVFVEDKVDFDALQRVLGNMVDADKERFGLNWPGKSDCMTVIQAPSVATLKPCRDESENFDETENLFIEGDNLEVLKLLQKSYFGKVKMIYIDPPYNTDGDFIYPDKYAENLKTYLAYTEQSDAEGIKFSTTSESEGRYHSKWLSMIFPRIFLAKNLLREDGILVSHIDEHEAVNLQLVLDDVFGPENNLGPIVWDKKNPKGDATKIATQHETILVYAKNVEYFRDKHPLKRSKNNAERMIAKARGCFEKLNTECLPENLEAISREFDLPIDLANFKKTFSLNDAVSEYRSWLSKQDVSGGEAAYKHIDSNGQVFRTVSMAWPNKKKAPDEYFIPLVHPVTGKPCPVPDRGWRNPPKTMEGLLKKNLIIFGEDETKQPERKYLLEENMDENIPSVLPFGGSDDALLKAMGIPFDNPKPVGFSKSLLNYFLGGEGIVIDFFAGSGTVAHACFELNNSNNSQANFILVQLPELLSPDKDDQKVAYKFCIENSFPPNIAEISKERVRRAGKRISESKDSQEIDLGFKVLKLDRSNFKVWDGKAEAFDENGDQLEMHVDHVSKEASAEDILYELLLKAGFELTTRIEKHTMAGKEVFAIAEGALLICLEKEVTEDLIDALAEADPIQVICLDEAFQGNDQLKTNAVQTFASRAAAQESEIVFSTV